MNIDEDNFDEFPVAYSIDNAILMHRDAHFGGDFDVMIAYYQKDGRGISKDFDIERIQSLAQTEKATGKNLSPIMLSGAEAEKVADSRKMYQDLRSLCESTNATKKIPRLVAELILSENEEIPQATNAIVAEKSAAVPALIDLLRSEEFHDPLSPGYGEAPALAAECLGKIGDKRAIISLFEAIGSGDFFDEDTILSALKTIGAPAKEFLLKVLHGKPITSDNEQAALALLSFKGDQDVAITCLKMLQEIDIVKHTPLATYLILCCEGLSSPQDRKALVDLASKDSTPKILKQDIAAITKSWNSPSS